MLLFCDGFDHYHTEQLGEKYVQSAGASIVPNGRFGGGYCLLLAEGNGNYVQYNTGDQSQLIVGFAFNPSGLPGSGSSNQLPIVYFDEPASGGRQGSLILNNAGGLEYHATINNVDTILAASPNGIIKTNTFQYIEISVLFSPTQGAIAAQVNGVNVFSVTGVNTAPTGNSYAAVVDLVMGNAFYGTLEFDDFYICNGSGEYNNSFLGDISVVALFPSGAGLFTEFTINGETGVENWQVAGQPYPNDEYYLSSSVQNTKDSYMIGALPSGVQQLVALQIVASAQKDNSGTRVLGVGFGNQTSGIVWNGGFLPLTSTYQMYTQPYDINPLTNQPWAVGDLSGAQIGIEVAS